jgi:hypothetical protein
MGISLERSGSLFGIEIAVQGGAMLRPRVGGAMFQVFSGRNAMRRSTQLFAVDTPMMMRSDG